MKLRPGRQQCPGHESLGQPWWCDQAQVPERPETAPWRNGQSATVFLQDVVAFPVAGVVGDSAGTVPTPGSRSQGPGAVECSWSLWALHGKTEAASRVSLNARGKGQSLASPSEGSVHHVPPWATQAAAGRRPRLPTSGRPWEPRVRNLAASNKAKEAPTLAQHFFPETRDRTPKA